MRNIRLKLFIAMFLVNICFADSYDSIVAVVNDTPISKLETDDLMKLMVVSNMISAEEYKNPNIGKAILNYKIERTILYDFAKATNFSPSINPEALEKKFLDLNKYTRKDLDENLNAYGVSHEHFLAYLKETAIIENLTQKSVVQGIKITDEDINKFKGEFENRATRYLLQDFFIEQNTAKELPASSIIEIIQAAAEGFSVGKTVDSSVTSINLGYRTLEELPEIYKNVAVKLKKGSISTPITAPNGTHILLMLNIKEQVAPTKDEIRVILMKKKYETEYPLWLDKLKKDNYIKIYK